MTAEANGECRAEEQIFTCLYCGKDVPKRPIIFFGGLWPFRSAKGECSHCGAKYTPEFGSQMDATIRYFYLPFFVSAFPLLYLFVVIENGSDELGFSTGWQVVGLAYSAVGWLWFLYFMPKLIKQRWHKYDFMWFPPK